MFLDVFWDIVSITKVLRMFNNNTVHSDFILFVDNTKKSLKHAKIKCLKSFNNMVDINCQDIVQKVTHAENEVITSEKDTIFNIMIDARNYLNSKVKNFTHEEHDVHVSYFRENMSDVYLEGAIFYRCMVKPLGYSGDYETMRMCYDDTYEGFTILGKIMHKYATELNCSQAVRNRVVLLQNAAINKKDILSVACGPAYEVPDIVNKNPHITLLDQDKEALIIAKKIIGNRPNVNYLHMSVVSMNESIEKYDFIYSMGLFDYLSNNQVAALCEHMYKMLHPGGEILVGNFHTSCINRYEMQYWCNWPLNYRTEKQMLELSPAGASSSIIYENTGTQMFLKLGKPYSKS